MAILQGVPCSRECARAETRGAMPTSLAAALVTIDWWIRECDFNDAHPATPFASHPQHELRRCRLHRHPGPNIGYAPVRCCGRRSPRDISKLSLQAAGLQKLALQRRVRVWGERPLQPDACRRSRIHHTYLDSNRSALQG